MTLLFHQAALGDFMLTLPLVRGLAAAGPTTVVVPWSRGRLAMALIQGVGAMDIEMFEFTRLHAAGGPRAVSPAVGELFEGATLVVSFVSDGRDVWAANVRRLAPRADLVCLSSRPPAGWAGHVADWHRAELLGRGVEVADVPVPPAGDRDGPIVVHPGSGGVAKCWPAGKYEAVLDALQQDGRPVRPIYGEAEAERWPADRLARWRDRYRAVGCTTLEALLEQLLPAAAYLGNDAGPTHLAAQCGLPTVALFGPTDPRLWAPRGPAVTVLAPPTPTAMTWLDVPPVLRSLRQVLEP